MKDLSFLVLKNHLGAKMRKNFKNFCNGDGSTSTLNQKRFNQDMSCMATPSLNNSPFTNHTTNHAPTLEEMILQLELEEEAARKAKVNEYEEIRRRMSCVSNSDVLRSARNALNQYPRFSLDEKDAMYRSSFKSFAPVIGGYQGGRKSVCCGPGITGRLLGGGFNLGIERNLHLPQTLVGKNVVWCKPGVVPKLMGLEAMPMPIPKKTSKGRIDSSTIKKQNLRRVERYEKEKRRFNVGMNRCKEISEITSVCSTTNDYSKLKPNSPANSRRPAREKEWWMDGRPFTSVQRI